MEKETRYIRIHLPKELFMKVTIACAYQNTNKTALITKILEEYFSKNDCVPEEK